MMDQIHEKYRHVLDDVPEDSILGVQLAKQPKSLGPMPPSQEEILQMAATVLAENPWLANTDRNGSKIVEWIEQNNLAFSLESIRGAVQVLREKLEKAKPPEPPPPPAAPPEPVEVLEPGQLSLHASQWEMKQATPAQLKDLIRRRQAAGLK